MSHCALFFFFLFMAVTLVWILELQVNWFIRLLLLELVYIFNVFLGVVFRMVTSVVRAVEFYTL